MAEYPPIIKIQHSDGKTSFLNAVTWKHSTHPAIPNSPQVVMANMGKKYVPVLDLFPQEKHWQILTEVAQHAKIWEGAPNPEQVPFESLLKLHTLVDISPAKLPLQVNEAIAVHAFLSEVLPRYYIIGWDTPPAGVYLWDTDNPVASLVPFQKYNDFRSPVGDLLTALIVETPWTHPFLAGHPKPKSLTHGELK